MSGVPAVECLKNNGGYIRPPAGGLNFNNTVEIPKHTSGRDSTDTNGGITTFVEVSNDRGPKLTVTSEIDTSLFAVAGVTSGREESFFS